MGITLWQYYLDMAARITDGALEDVASLEEWEAVREGRKREFFRSMGLDPMPERCDLRLAEHGEFAGDGYRARKIAFQILPDCWATACVFYPDPLPAEKAPGVLYVCGHTHIGVWGYQPHAMMWARRGYVCLVVDTIEQHDNPGEHHGLYYGGGYDWLSLGYSGAGGELWNSIRALDVLADLPEVDAERIGSTGNSGGGALSFYVGIADERIKAVATSCGVTRPKHTLARRNVMGHCDCIYNHNPFQRDTADFAALMAPRPLLFCFGASDGLFTPEEFRSLTETVRKVYALHGCEERCDLSEHPRGHGYQPKTIRAINEWFDRYVAGETRPDLELGERELPESVTAVFNGLTPNNDHLDLLPQLLSSIGSIRLPEDAEDWRGLREEAVARLRTEALHTLDSTDEELVAEQVGDWDLGDVETSRRKAYACKLGGMDVWIDASTRPDDSDSVLVSLAERHETARDAIRRLADYAAGQTLVGIEPRGAGFSGNRDQGHHLLRAGALTGLTPTMLLIHDLEHVMAWLRAQPYVEGKKVFLHGRGEAGVACLYHGVMHEDVAGVITEDLPATHRDGAYILGVLRVMDINHAVGLMAPRPVAALVRTPLYPKHWAKRVYDRLGLPDRLVGAWTSTQTAFDRVLEEG